MRWLQLHRLRTFLRFLRSGGIGRAAEALHVTQPAVTAHQGAGSQPRREAAGSRARRHPSDQEGGILLRYARRLEGLADAIERGVIDPTGAEARASETFAQTWLPDFVEAIHQRSPRLAIKLDADVTASLCERLLNVSPDLAVPLGPLSHVGGERRSARRAA